MPIFNYKCKNCEKKMLDVFVPRWDTLVTCKYCGREEQEKIPSKFLADIFPKDGIFLEHVSSEGKLFHSKKEMKQYAKENDLELGAL